MKQGRIIKVSGPLVIADNMKGSKMFDVVRVGIPKLLGEIIELKDDLASIQVYEETAGIGPDEPIFLTNEPLCVDLGPGLIGSIYDGIQRPLDKIREISGDYILRGAEADALNKEKKWKFIPLKSKNEKVVFGDILGEIEETQAVKHKIMVPEGIEGVLQEIEKGDYKITDTIAKIKTTEGKIINVTMSHKWPVRKNRPYQNKIQPTITLVTGQRVIDTFFPVTKGGVACIPGPFGAGKTVVLHEIAKWADADVIVYVGCGERGNEMTDVLTEFPHLKDPKTGRPLMERSVLIANTSNMPVAAREASVYTGITIAEYYRDMGYDVALLADSTSRWAEALREISGRLEEMPGEEGYPAYLGMRVAQFYERAGRTTMIDSSKNKREGSLSVVGAVSPPGGDLSDPMVQATLRVVKVFWNLEYKLAYKRHFPAINWLSSYSLYIDNIKDFLSEKIADDFLDFRNRAIKILQEEERLLEIARLVGVESLSLDDRLILEIAKSLREDFLHQNAFDPIDVHSSLLKQYRILKGIVHFYDDACKKLKNNVSIEEIAASSEREGLKKLKYLNESEI